MVTSLFLTNFFVHESFRRRRRSDSHRDDYRSVSRRSAFRQHGLMGHTASRQQGRRSSDLSTTIRPISPNRLLFESSLQRSNTSHQRLSTHARYTSNQYHRGGPSKALPHRRRRSRRRDQRHGSTIKGSSRTLPIVTINPRPNR